MSKGSKINVGSIEEDVEILNKFANMTFLYGNRVSLNKKNLLEVQRSIINILSDYTRQKQINEEHQKINGELREAINTVEKEEEDWIRAYQEEKDKQFAILRNSISKQVIKDYLKEEKERFEVYKKESETNENLKLGMYKHLGAKNMCEKILGIEKIVTLD